jgi:hypothetical protein
MEFEKRYKNSRVIIGYQDDSLEYVFIEKDGHILEHRYKDDEILEILLDGHNKTIDRNVITENVLSARYINGKLESMDGVVFKGDVQIERVNVSSRNLYYKGVFMGTVNNINPVVRNELYTLTETRGDVTVQANLRDSDTILFLLGFSKTSMFPYSIINNLPALGLKEFMMTISDLFREGVYLTYMEKLFGFNIREVRWDSSQDELSPSQTLRVKASLNSCYMRMDTTDNSFKCSIADSQGVIYDYNLAATDPDHQDFHYWVMFKLPRLYK